MLPDITAILPTTKKRLSFLPLALENFKNQEFYGKAELVVASEDEECRVLASQTINRLRLLRTKIVATPKGIALGEKRNRCCSEATSPWITFWDDDDWSASKRLEITQQTIEKDKATNIIGSPTMLVHELVAPRRRTYAYMYRRTNETFPEWFYVGGTLTFKKALWETHRFDPQETCGEETWWQMYDGQKIFVREDLPSISNLYIAMTHGKNTSSTQLTVPQSSSYALVGNRDYVRDLMGEDFLLQYERAATLITAQT